MDLDKKYREKIQYILKETPNYTDKVFELEVLLKQYHAEQCNIDSVVSSLPTEDEIVKNLTIPDVSVSVYCKAPEHILPCRHACFSLCQYNGHCNHQSTER